MINIKKELLKTARNSIRLNIGGAAGGAELKLGATRFGGRPDVPDDFKWAYYEGAGMFGGEVKSRPLSFLAQFDLEEITEYDTENLLPKTGVLSFFYELESQTQSYDPDEKGFARVYWFEDKSALHTAEFPDDLGANKPGFDYRLPTLKITAKSEKSYQSYPDFLLQRAKLVENWEEFEAAQKSIGIAAESNLSKLLGWANPFQDNMTIQCELLSRGYYLGDREGRSEVTQLDRQEAEQWSAQDWLPLFQLDTVTDGDFKLMFGDLGRIYFYIRRDDLAARNFDDVWIFLQS